MGKQEKFVHQVYFNEGVRCNILNSCAPEEVGRLYEALVEFQKILEDEKLRIEFRLEPGTMVVFNNNRVLHGRAAFADGESDSESKQLAEGSSADISREESDARRFLVGGYVDWGDFWSRK